MVIASGSASAVPLRASTLVVVRGDCKLNGVSGSAGERKSILGDWESWIKTSVASNLEATTDARAVLDAEADASRPAFKQAGGTNADTNITLAAGELTIELLIRRSLVRIQPGALCRAENGRATMSPCTRCAPSVHRSHRVAAVRPIQCRRPSDDRR